LPNVEISSPQEFTITVILVWALGWFLRQREAGAGPLSPDGIRASDVLLMPFSIRSAYVHAGSEYSKVRERIANVAFCAVVWLVGVAILASLVHTYGPGLGSCPAGTHLQGGQGGGEQFCE
jgi:hypothetical protein